MEKLSYQDVKKQSIAVFNQFGEKTWKPFAKENSKLLNRRDANELRNCGNGKVLLSIAYGASLEDHAEIIKKYRDRVDIICSDKAFKPLVEHGITPDYVMLCDCNILWPKWGPEDIDTSNIKMIATPYANVAWTRRWKGPIYFYCNRDAIGSEKVFSEIMGQSTRVVPASSNVSNAQVVFMTGMDEFSRISFAGYDKILLTGYDYSWRPEGNYYAWSNPKPKRYYMRHKLVRDINQQLCYTSENLVFSARWLAHYLGAWNFNAINCSGRGLLECRQGDLEKELKCIRPEYGARIRYALGHVENAQKVLNSAAAMYNLAREEMYYGSR